MLIVWICDQVRQRSPTLIVRVGLRGEFCVSPVTHNRTNVAARRRAFPAAPPLAEFFLTTPPPRRPADLPACDFFSTSRNVVTGSLGQTRR